MHCLLCGLTIVLAQLRHCVHNAATLTVTLCCGYARLLALQRENELIKAFSNVSVSLGDVSCMYGSSPFCTQVVPVHTKSPENGNDVGASSVDMVASSLVHSITVSPSDPGRVSFVLEPSTRQDLKDGVKNLLSGMSWITSVDNSQSPKSAPPALGQKPAPAPVGNGLAKVRHVVIFEILCAFH